LLLFLFHYFAPPPPPKIDASTSMIDRTAIFTEAFGTKSRKREF
jgi:hypothetical protein